MSDLEFLLILSAGFGVVNPKLGFGVLFLILIAIALSRGASPA